MKPYLGIRTLGREGQYDSACVMHLRCKSYRRSYRRRSRVSNGIEAFRNGLNSQEERKLRSSHYGRPVLLRRAMGRSVGRVLAWVSGALVRNIVLALDPDDDELVTANEAAVSVAIIVGLSGALLLLLYILLKVATNNMMIARTRYSAAPPHITSRCTT